MAFPGRASRFSVLKIEDDEDEFDQVLKAGETKAKDAAKPSAAAKKKARRRKKAAEDAESKAIAATEEKVIEEQFENQLESAIKESRETFEHEEVVRKSGPWEQVPTALQKQTMVAAKHLKKSHIPAAPEQKHTPLEIVPAGSKKEKQRNLEQSGQSLFKEKLEEAEEKIKALATENEELKETGKKYKDRYKKLCELLKEAEVKEKAQLIVEVEKSMEIREELTEEVSELVAQLEQARSRIRELETELYHKTAK